MAKAATPVPSGYHAVTIQLSLDDAAQGIEWYKKAFGAEEIGRHPGPDGRIMHAEINIGDTRIMVNDVMQGMKGPKAYGGSPASFWLYVDDCDAMFNRAVAAGATVQMPVSDQFWGDRGGVVSDPAGYTWWIATRKEDLSPAELDQRAADFFARMQQAATSQ